MLLLLLLPLLLACRMLWRVRRSRKLRTCPETTTASSGDTTNCASCSCNPTPTDCLRISTDAV